ncbi:MAG: hypothetical protein ACREQX_06725 [Candidatus Binataceae bacterium]
MLLDGRLGRLCTQLFDVGGNCNRLNVIEAEPVLLASVEEPLYRPRVSHPRVAVADGRGEKFDEAAAGALALGGDGGRQGLKAGARQLLVEPID